MWLKKRRRNVTYYISFLLSGLLVELVLCLFFIFYGARWKNVGNGGVDVLLWQTDFYAGNAALKYAFNILV
jgi:hypothetical protein